MNINYRLFFILLASGVAAGVAVTPYALALSSLPLALTPALLVAQIAQLAVLLAIAIYVGLRLGKKFGLGMPILEGYLRGENQRERLRAILGPSIGIGIGCGVLIIALGALWPALTLSFIRIEMAIPLWKLLLTPFYGGISEEILLRLFGMTLVIWIISRITRTPDGTPRPGIVWTAIILSSIIFGLGHLPVTGQVVSIDVSVVARALLLNGVGGVAFGWLYWKKGLESAMIAHFSADVVLHIAMPLFARFLL